MLGIGYVFKIDIRLTSGDSLLFIASGSQDDERITYMSGWLKVSR